MIFTRPPFIFITLCFLISLPRHAHCDKIGNQWRTLNNVQELFGVSAYSWDGNELVFSNDQTRVCFYPGRRKATVNGINLWLNVAPEGAIHDWRLSSIDLNLLQMTLLAPRDGEPQPLRVMLDPGHGGEDAGAVSPSPRVLEKDLVLNIAQQLGAKLEAANIQVDYTRTNDVTVSLEERSRLARQKKSDLFVSLHVNHADNQEAYGLETYVLTPQGCTGTAIGSPSRGWQIGNLNDYHNTLLGFLIHAQLVTTIDTLDRGLKRQSFFVLRETSCPAVLLEFGFLSNQTETLRMQTAAWQDACATAVAQGLLNYARKVVSLNHAVAAQRTQNEQIKADKAELASVATPSANISTSAPPTLSAAVVAAPITSDLPAVNSNPPPALVTTTLNTNNAAEIETLLTFYTNTVSITPRTPQHLTPSLANQVHIH